MADMNLDADIALLIGVAISVVFSFLSFLIAWLSSSQRTQAETAFKVAEFRQAWINELRECLSEFQSLATVEGGDPRRNPRFYALGTKIELLMNPDDPDYERLHELLYRYLSVSDGTRADKYRINPEFISVCQGLLKREWERLKIDIRDQRV